LLAIVTVFTTGCIINIGDINDTKGNGRIIAKEKTTEQFNSVVLGGVGRINIYPGQKYDGEEYKVIVTTDSNIHDVLEVNVKNNCLYIDHKNNYSLSPTKLVMDVYLPYLFDINLTGVGDIYIDGGKASNLEIELSGVGNVYAKDYQVKNVEVSLTGVGDIQVWATDNLSGTLTGIGDIKYRGDPVRNIKVSGIGKVKKL